MPSSALRPASFFNLIITLAFTFIHARFHLRLLPSLALLSFTFFITLPAATMATAPDRLHEGANAPAMPKPADWQDQTDLTQTIIVARATLVLLSTIAIAIRCYTRKFLDRKILLEDWLTVLGWALWMTYVSVTSFFDQHGGGLHQWKLTMADLAEMLKWIYISAILYGPTVTVIRAAICVMYMRMFVTRQGKNYFYWGAHAILWSNVITYSVCTAFQIFACHPRERYWGGHRIDGWCFNIDAMNIASATFNSISDFALLLLPQSVIWKLHLPVRRRIGLSLIFIGGLGACACSVVRLAYCVILLNKVDLSYYLAAMGLWVYAEIAVGLICASTPTFPRFWKHVAPKLARVGGKIRIRRRLGGRINSRGLSDTALSFPPTPTESQRDALDNSEELGGGKYLGHPAVPPPSAGVELRDLPPVRRGPHGRPMPAPLHDPFPFPTFSRDGFTRVDVQGGLRAPFPSPSLPHPARGIRRTVEVTVTSRCASSVARSEARGAEAAPHAP
ncbi:hypothetical protein BDY21DRAFT_351277 [Lineolata rhizophorae]|uniref:Rhodopsin domain-containing protein n=1 Tax=Lineolata rhizophorae TaxID=578093 RepID=A0A6A6NU87_9PEZI|nr:hypothetical protein BDY21DRAFT_351277 [Lineolata rhizophorae]